MRKGEWEKLLEVRGHFASEFRKHSIWNYDSAMRYLERYNRLKKVDGWMDWDGDRAVDYIAWLRTQGVGDRWLRKIAELGFRLIETLQMLDPDSVSPAFYVPRAHLPVLSPTYRTDDGPRPDDIQRILEAALKEAIATVKVTTASDLVPFGVLLAIRTGMNADSLYNLDRECLAPIGADFHLIWSKPRAGRELRQRYSIEPWGVVEIVRRLQSLTTGRLLFTAPGARGGHGIHSFEPGLSEFCVRHGLRRFQLKDLRPAIASWIYQLSGGDIFEVRDFLGHKDVQTTLLYLHEWVVRPQQEQALAEGQAAMFEKWGIPRKEQNR